MFNVGVYSLLVRLIPLSFIAPYLSVGFNMGLVDNIFLLFLLLISVLVLFAKKELKIPKNFFIGLSCLLLYILLTHFLFFTSVIPFYYELFHLLKVFYFFPILYFLNYEQDKIDSKLLKIISRLLFINIFIIILQHATTPAIVPFFSSATNAFYFQNANMLNRWCGLLIEPNVLGGISCLLFILNELRYSDSHKKILIISGVSVVLSTSKVCIVIFMIFLIIKYARPRYLLYSITFVSLIALLAYSANKNTIDSKLSQYTYLVTSIVNNQDVDFDKVEHRAQAMLIGSRLIYENFPSGTGLGSWGDASSKWNSIAYNYKPMPLSDTAFFHYLVEQGALVFLYWGLIITPLLFIKEKKIGLYMIVFLTIISLPSMGFSMKGWPILFCYLFARLLVNKKNIVR